MVTIRRAGQGDVAAIRACAHEAYRRYVAAIGRKPAPMLADFEALTGAGFVHVALDDRGELAGFIVFFEKDGAMFLENVAVRTDAAGQGVGRALIAVCEAEARRRELARVTLYTNEKMVENLSIYPHLGYRETGRRVEDGFARVYFEKPLA